MSIEKFDVGVVGLGAMGSAAAYQLAKEGTSVVGFDQFAPPHGQGSTHGDTRITRLAVGEGDEYLPVVMRSHQIWRDIERQTGQQLFNQCGFLVIITPKVGGELDRFDGFTEQIFKSAEENNIEHERLTNMQLRERFPQFKVSDNDFGYFEPEGGYLIPEKCVSAQLELAKKNGARLHFNEAITSLNDKGDGVVLTSDKGDYEVGKLPISAGPWVANLLPEYADVFKVYRQVLYWFDIDDEVQYENFKNSPTYAWIFGSGPTEFVYGFPAIDGPNGGIKVATEEYEQGTTTPGGIERTVSKEEVDEMYETYIKDRFDGLDGQCNRSATCMYTETPDHGFVIDNHPKHKNIIVASPCSGHGFKHSAAIGEILMQLATKGKSDIDISKFSFDRLT